MILSFEDGSTAALHAPAKLQTTEGEVVEVRVTAPAGTLAAFYATTLHLTIADSAKEWIEKNVARRKDQDH